ncbi:hypothetical protein ACX80W_10855 [Arthrobacter sp. TMN-37]
MEPMQKGLVLGVLGGSVLSLLTGQLPWMAAGVFLGVGVGHIIGRRRRHVNPEPVTTHKIEPPLRRMRASPEETGEDREEQLRWPATFRGIRILDCKTDRVGALEQIRDTVPGFPPERYEAELDEALARIEEYRVGIRTRRAELVQEAREMDALNGVFALRYFNRRFSGNLGEYGLGPINLPQALGDLYPREVIEEAVARSDAMIDEGIGMGVGSWDHEPNIAYLRQAHPGFNDRALSDALDWGHLIHR